MNTLQLITNVTTFITGMTLFFVIFLIAVKKYINQKSEHEKKR